MSAIRPRLALGLTAVLLGLAVWLAADVQRESATRAADRLEASQRLLTSMLDQETGLRGYQLTGEAQFLAPLRAGQSGLKDAQDDIARSADGDVRILDPLEDADAAATAWLAQAEREIARTRARGPHRPTLDSAVDRKQLMDAFRAEVHEIQDELEQARDRDLRLAAGVSVGISLLVFLVIGVAGLVWWRRGERLQEAVADRERAYRDTQAEFAQALQVVSSEDDANALLKRHLERSLRGRHVTVLNRNNSANRLEPRTPVECDDFALTLEDAEPRSCVAIRLARPHAASPGDDALLTCDVCGKVAGERLCAPLLVSGEVIGSVLSVQQVPFDAQAHQRMEDSVTTAAPVLANLRAVAIAETRAATDALTGLPNRRAVNDTLKRMIAQAGRGLTPLTAISVDLDRFKDINDRYGHDKGDEVLAAAAATLQAGVRASDFAGRMGGEELIVLAPDTGLDGGAVLAESLRQALEGLHVDGVDRPITASFGVASYPETAATPELLLRKSDRALYAAKEGGRNRVEIAGEAGDPIATSTPA